MAIPRAIEAGGARVPVIDAWGGPRLDPSGPLEALAWVVNDWLDGALPDLPGQVLRGEPALGPRGGVMPATDDDLTDERRARWREAGGGELGAEPGWWAR